ncbi:hypothetical protein OFEAOIEE_LOCUS4445 [Methylorubrum extorquens]
MCALWALRYSSAAWADILCEVTQWNFAYQCELMQCSMAMASLCCSPSKGVSSLDFGPLPHGRGLFSSGSLPGHASRTTIELIPNVLFAIPTQSNAAKPSKGHRMGQRCVAHSRPCLRIIPGGLDLQGDRQSLSACTPIQLPSQRFPAVLAAFAQFLQRAFPLTVDEPEGRLSAALSAFLAARETGSQPDSASWKDARCKLPAVMERRSET